jgi:hypothetical protein
MKFIVKERQDDVQQISSLLKNSQKKVLTDMMVVIE